MAETMVLACSGGSDVGELADRIARALKQAGTARMYCLAGVGGQLASMVKTAATAATLLAIALRAIADDRTFEP